MDDRQSLVEQAGPLYRCPADSHAIDRATHLARLASFYPACGQCEHRDDIHELTATQASQWKQVLRRRTQGPCFAGEGLEGDSVNDMGPDVVARFATSLAVALWRRHERSVAPPALLVGSDGHWTTADLMSTACQALQFAGCRILESSCVTAAALATAANHFETDAALWIGNATGQPHAMALRVWGRCGRPWSSPGSLDALREIHQGTVTRPKRRGGTLERAHAGAVYLSPLEPQFHALRPLRFVLDTVCQPLASDLRRLTSRVACELLRPGAILEATAAPAQNTPTFLEHRLANLGWQVTDRQAHFGLWIDGAGESFRIVDDTGRAVDCAKVFRKLAGYVVDARPGATILVEPKAGEAVDRAMASAGARVVRGAPTREGTCAAMESSGAVFGEGPRGTYWFAGPPAAPDALLATSLLLTILSQSDRPVCEVLDEA